MTLNLDFSSNVNLGSKEVFTIKGKSDMVSTELSEWIPVFDVLTILGFRCLWFFVSQVVIKS